MSRFLGKFIGTILGLSAASWGGGLIGFILGHLHDQSLERRLFRRRYREEDNFFPDFQIDTPQKIPFAMSVIALGAKLAKCDGPISNAEILAFKHTFRASEAHIHEVGNLFNQARSSAEGYEPHAARLAQILNMHYDILEHILASLFYIAKADSANLSNEEITFLRHVGIIFGFSETNFIQAAARAGVYLKAVPPRPKEATPYDILGLPTSVTDDVLKRTYHSLIRKYHPDKLQASGLPEQRVNEANEKVKQINAAYSDILKSRKTT